MGARDVRFDEGQLNMICGDQMSILQSLHIGGYDCISFGACPHDHFENENIEEISERQEIIRLILGDANES